jgi:ferredoxin
MKRATTAYLEQLFRQLAGDYDVRVPVRLPDGNRVFGSPDDGPLALEGGPLAAKPTTVFFPQEEDLVVLENEGGVREKPGGRPLFVVGFTPRDIRCLLFADRFFGDGWRDDLYFRQRESAVVAAVSGYCGPAGRLYAPAGGGCDLEFVAVGNGWLVVPYSDKGAAIAVLIPDEAPDDALAALLDRCPAVFDDDERIINHAADLLAKDLVPDSFWEEIAAECILCTGCNLVCPTCTCFGVRDWRFSDRVERGRVWDSCQLDGFMREAGGHNPLGTEALRTRRRIHHKLAADRIKWGELGCLVCGRCDAVCPTGIGIVAVAARMVAAFGNPGSPE